MVSEWVKIPALWSSIGAYRHGFMEAINEKTGIVIFAPPGQTQHSAYRLSEELRNYGARVLIISNGNTLKENETSPISEKHINEYLSPLMDVIPVQLFIEKLARQRCIIPGFRYISKVIAAL